jgi:hypothetical protein
MKYSVPNRAPTNTTIHKHKAHATTKAGNESPNHAPIAAKRFMLILMQ